MTPDQVRPIRILRIIARMNVGGPAWQASVLTRGLSCGPFESQLLVGDVGADEADFIELRDPDLPVRRLPSLGRSVRFGDDIRAFVGIYRLIREFRPDIVHTHTTKAGLLGRLAAVTCRVPVRVHTFHGHLLHGYFGRVVSRALILVEKVLASQTTVLVAVGEQVRDDLVKAGIGRSDQYTVIPPGVRPAEVQDKALARVQLGLPANSPVVLYVGRLSTIKRPDRLVEAMRIVLEDHPNVVLAIAGEGELLKSTQRLAEPLGSSVRFLGWQPDISRLCSAADCLVLTSDNEGMPVSLIEAAMAGVPSVTTDVGSAREVVVDGVTGFVVPADAAAVADGLVRLLDHGLGSQMGKAAKERATTEFDAGRLIADHEILYERLVADRVNRGLGD